jgi:UDP-N-acetylmuramate dehydrogenase
MQLKTESLTKHSSLRVGGKANIFSPQNIQELQDFLSNNNQELFFLGLGSNTLFTKNFNKIVIKTTNLKYIGLNQQIISVEAGVTLKKLASFAKQHNITGANWLATIPGSVGGALTMNAGCFGREFWDAVKSVKTIDNKGKISTKTKNDFEISYRHTNLQANEYFISCELDFKNYADVDKKLLESRYQSQPIGSANCGSVFKNPPNNYAAKLIEDAGLKGKCIGGACISEKHANFIINNDNASSQDIQELITLIQNQVKTKFNIELETEVVIV